MAEPRPGSLELRESNLLLALVQPPCRAAAPKADGTHLLEGDLQADRQMEGRDDTQGHQTCLEEEEGANGERRSERVSPSCLVQGAPCTTAKQPKTEYRPDPESGPRDAQCRGGHIHADGVRNCGRSESESGAQGGPAPGTLKWGVQVDVGGAGGAGRGTDPTGVGRHRNECGGISEMRKGCEVTDHTPLQLHGEHRRRRGVEERTEIHRRSFAHSARTI